MWQIIPSSLCILYKTVILEASMMFITYEVCFLATLDTMKLLHLRRGKKNQCFFLLLN